MGAAPPQKFAVLIDAENACAARIEVLLAEIAIRGSAVIKRAYGDWTENNLRSWKEHLLKQSIQPIQQFAYTRGKNATDSALIIDAMDLLHSKQVNGFCLVSSDSDFTRLATRIREDGLIVYGLGKRHTPRPFVTACDEFIYVDDLDDLSPSDTENDISRRIDSRIETSLGSSQLSNSAWLREILLKTMLDVPESTSWTPLSVIGALLTQRHPTFHERMKGHYSNLLKLVESDSNMELRHHSTDHGSSTISVRVKRQSK